MTTTSDVADPIVEAARHVSPVTAEAFERLQEFVATDGALSAVDKALFVAAAAATQQQPPLVRRALELGKRLGLDAERSRGAVRLMGVNRGEEAFLLLAAAVDAVFGPAPLAQATGETPSTVEDALEYFRTHFGGQVPERQQLFAALVPRAFEAYHLFHRSSIRENVLPVRTCELLLCALTGAAGHQPLLEIHMRGARAAGADDREIAEALLCAVPVVGFTAWAGGAASLVASRS